MSPADELELREQLERIGRELLGLARWLGEGKATDYTMTLPAMSCIERLGERVTAIAEGIGRPRDGEEKADHAK